jgi:hypothetical protein
LGPWGRRCQCSWRGVPGHKVPGIGGPRVGRSGWQCWRSDLGRLCAHLCKFITTIQNHKLLSNNQFGGGFPSPNTQQHQDSIWVWVWVWQQLLR